jgi:hypothetical protein
LFQFHLNSFIVGFAVASAVMFIWYKLCDLKDYFVYRDWCDSNNIDNNDLNYAKWQISKIVGIEVVEYKEDNNGNSGKN